MAKKNAATEEAEQKALVAIEGTAALDMLFEETSFNTMQRAANMFAGSDLVPEHFRGKPANVMVALQLSRALEVNPLLLMMKIYEVHGKFGFEAQLMIALANSRGPFKGSIRYRLEEEGDERKCTAYAYHGDDGEICEATCSIKIAKAEGWFDRKDRKGNYCSKWRTMPDLMLQYRAATFLIRTHCPDVLMGMPTADELHDIEPAIEVSATVNDIEGRMAKARETAPKPPKAEPAPKPPAEQEKPAEAATAPVSDEKKPALDAGLLAKAKGLALAAEWSEEDFWLNLQSVGNDDGGLRGIIKTLEPTDAPVAATAIPDDVFAKMGLTVGYRPDAERAWLLAMGDDTAPDWDSRKFLAEHTRLSDEAKSPLKGLDALVEILENEAKGE